MNDNAVNFTAQDILAAIGFEAQRLSSGVAQHAAGSVFPNPVIIQKVIDRMSELNKTLLQFGALLQSPTGGMSGSGGMDVRLDN